MIASKDKPEQFHSWLFLYTNLFLHEIGGHYLYSYMNKGSRNDTPPRFDGWTTFSNEPGKGESGRFLETLFFGGNLEYYHDPEQGRDQVCVPSISSQSSITNRIIRPARCTSSTAQAHIESSETLLLTPSIIKVSTMLLSFIDVGPLTVLVRTPFSVPP